MITIPVHKDVVRTQAFLSIEALKNEKHRISEAFYNERETYIQDEIQPKWYRPWQISWHQACHNVCRDFGILSEETAAYYWSLLEIEAAINDYQELVFMAEKCGGDYLNLDVKAAKLIFRDGTEGKN